MVGGRLGFAFLEYAFSGWCIAASAASRLGATAMIQVLGSSLTCKIALAIFSSTLCLVGKSPKKGCAIQFVHPFFFVKQHFKLD